MLRYLTLAALRLDSSMTVFATFAIQRTPIRSTDFPELLFICTLLGDSTSTHSLFTCLFQLFAPTQESKVQS